MYRQRNGFVFAGCRPDPAATQFLRSPLGAPLLDGPWNIVSEGALRLPAERSWQHEFRFFVDGQSDGDIRVRIFFPAVPGVHRRRLLTALTAAAIRFFLEAGMKNSIPVWILATSVLNLGSLRGEEGNATGDGFLMNARVPFEYPVDISGGSVGGVSSLDAADLDADGRVDVAVIEGGKHATAKTFAWFGSPRRPGDRWDRHEFNPGAPLKSFLGSAKFADIDNDGDPDLIVSSDMHSGDVRDADLLAFLNPLPDGDVYGTWSHRAIATGLPYHHINDMEVADMDADGRIDVVVRSLEPNEIHVFFQSGSSWEKKSLPTRLERSEGLAVGDLNGDGMPEITFTGFVLLAPGNPREQEYQRIAVDPGYHTVNQNTKECIGDIDADGRPDLLIAPAEAYRDGKPHDLAWYRNPGGDLTGSWVKTVVLAATNNTHTIRLARMDADDHLDIVAGVAWGDQAVTIYFNSGAGSFEEKQVVADDKGLYSGLVADIGADGDLDIVGQDTYARNSLPYLYESRLND